MRIETKIKLNDNLYIKDPEETDLGKQIINKSIDIIYNIGFDKFTFKKLALSIKSNEPSIYRYFENKQQLLSYIHSWYWSWVEFNIDNNLRNINPSKEKLKIIIKTLSNSSKYDDNFKHIDEEKLSKIVIRDYQGIFISDDNEKYNTFESFDSLCKKISSIIIEIAPNYDSPNALAISLIKLVYEQMFFFINHSDITEIKDINQLNNFIENILFSSLKIN
jgi:AcrR family transcriptional regulator